MKEELLQIKQDITDISNDLKTNLADKGVTADGTLSELVDKVPDIEGNVLGEIGWNLSEQPYLNDAIEYAKEILKNPKSTYQNDKQLVIFPKVDELELKYSMFDTSNLSLFPEGVRLTGSGSSAFYKTPLTYIDLTNLEVTYAHKMFYNCYCLKAVKLNTNFGEGITSMRSMFYNCLELTTPITLNVDSVTSLYEMFAFCNKIPSITILGDTSNLNETYHLFYYCSVLTYLQVPENFPIVGNAQGFLEQVKVPKIYGSFDYSGSTAYASGSYYWIFGFSSNAYIRYIVIKNLGAYQSGSYLNMEYSRVWGIANDEVPDARQSLIDSLITYSFDRASAGYSTMTWKLYADVKALLTEDEIAQITAKGYTLV